MDLPIHAVYNSHAFAASMCEYHQACMSAAPQFTSAVHDAWLWSFEGVMRTFDYPFETVRVSLALAVHLHVDAVERSSAQSQSHERVTAQAPVGQRPTGDIPAAHVPWLPMHRDLCDLFRGVATHRLQVTMSALALLGGLLGLG